MISSRKQLTIGVSSVSIAGAIHVKYLAESDHDFS